MAKKTERTPRAANRSGEAAHMKSTENYSTATVVTASIALVGAFYGSLALTVAIARLVGAC